MVLALFPACRREGGRAKLRRGELYTGDCNFKYPIMSWLTPTIRYPTDVDPLFAVGGKRVKNNFTLQISNPCMYAFYIIPDIKHNTCEYVKYERKTHCQERRVDKK